MRYLDALGSLDALLETADPSASSTSEVAGCSSEEFEEISRAGTALTRSDCCLIEANLVKSVKSS